MKLLLPFWLILIAKHCSGTTIAFSLPTPSGCRALPGDLEWPQEEIWKRELPNSVPRSRFRMPFSSLHPDYRLSARSINEVQDAVRFAARYNVRLSIINSGHDYFGRNDAPNGLWLDVSNLGGVRVSHSFVPTETGAQSPDASGKVNIMTSEPDVQAAATFGAGLSAVELNRALKASKLFAVSGAAAGVRIAGGWGQFGGHGPLTNQYGLGVDQWLEFKVVTADGSLKVANAKSNPDLFWALRGGGGGTFGVVVEATVKVYPHVPVVAYSWFIQSTTASYMNAVGIGNGSDGLFDATEHLAHEIPRLADSGSSAYLYFAPTNIRGFSIGVGQNNGTASWIKSLWDPVLQRMSGFTGNKPVQRHILEFANYQEFFDFTYLGGHKSGCYQIADRNGAPSDIVLDEKLCATSNSRLPDQAMVGMPPRFVPSPPGRMNLLDSTFMSKQVLQHPQLKEKMKSQLLGYGWLMLSGNKAHRPDDDVSVHPGWRSGYVHCLTANIGGLVGAGIFRDLEESKESVGSYGNEGSLTIKNWKQIFWGPSYPKLSQIKSKYDPTTLFWVSPGINADLLEVKQGRLCQRSVDSPPFEAVADQAPHNGNVNLANVITSYDELFGGLEQWANLPLQDIEAVVKFRNPA